MKKSSNLNSRVQSLVVANLLNNGVDSGRLVEFLNTCGYDTDKILRVALYLNGSIDKETPRDVVVNSKGQILVLTDYNFFDNVVFYETTYETTRYFDSESEANDWASKSRPSAYSGSQYKTENYCYPATAQVTNTGSMSLSDWNSNEIPTPEQLESLKNLSMF